MNHTELCNQFDSLGTWTDTEYNVSYLVDFKEYNKQRILSILKRYQETSAFPDQRKDGTYYTIRNRR